MNGYEKLANSIIRQAIDDYRANIQHLADNPKRAQKAARSIEEFFQSEWFTLLSDIDGNWLLNGIKEEFHDS